eukprot:m.18512 g.18512  ORF g.18512 m.18512 type:complete len:493 (+) comp7892_c0_seq1:291-1769(+)
MDTGGRTLSQARGDRDSDDDVYDHPRITVARTESLRIRPMLQSTASSTYDVASGIDLAAPSTLSTPASSRRSTLGITSLESNPVARWQAQCADAARQRQGRHRGAPVDTYQHSNGSQYSNDQHHHSQSHYTHAQPQQYSQPPPPNPTKLSSTPHPKLSPNGLPQITTARLKPMTHSWAHATVEIDEQGRVVLEMRHSHQHISLMIIPTRPDIIVQTQEASSQSSVRNEIFSTATLPSKYHSMYKQLHKLVEMIKAKTAKISLYQPTYRCLIMENSPPDIDFRFYGAEESRVVLRNYQLGEPVQFEIWQSKVEKKFESTVATVSDLPLTPQQKASLTSALHKYQGLESIANSSDESDSMYPIRLGRPQKMQQKQPKEEHAQHRQQDEAVQIPRINPQHVMHMVESGWGVLGDSGSVDFLFQNGDRIHLPPTADYGLFVSAQDPRTTHRFALDASLPLHMKQRVEAAYAFVVQVAQTQPTSSAAEPQVAHASST